MANLYKCYIVDCYFKDDRFITANDDGDYDIIDLCMEDDESLDKIEWTLMAQITDAEKALTAVRGEQRARSHKPCPHCGKIVMRALHYGDVYGRECSPAENRAIAVVCDATYGGCGANGGFAMSEDSAWEKWDRRAE